MNFATLQDMLAHWPSIAPDTKKGIDGVVDRVHQILLAIRQGSQNCAPDLAPLLRQVLLRESQLRGRAISLIVPEGPSWPTPEDWAKHSMSSVPVAAGFLNIRAGDWRPAWLPGASRDVFADVAGERVVRREEPCPVDPFIGDATGYTQYVCPGQREAIRAAFVMPPGSSLLVNLPTGSGKSLVGLAPALVNKRDGHLTVFVVPTVALAIDQARQMKGLIERDGSNRGDHHFAWHGGSSSAERVSILERIRSGRQRILFTSPEALTTSLMPAMFQAATAGSLAYLVIDEAHLVTQWGDDFRPAFQELAGLRRGLLRAAGTSACRTILLSATLTSETIDVLARLFGPTEAVQLVSANHLRPEPQYWAARVSSKDEKAERVVETLRHAPRPFIAYVTTRADVKWLYARLRQDGLRRIASFDGATSDVERARIINAWAANELDGVVATSAFGVGIDKGDVRTVIHATVAETLDRFYQEVGRGGRDGKSSASISIFEDRDWDVAGRLASPILVSDEIGLGRWDTLFQHRQETNHGGLIRIDLDVVPRHLQAGSEYNADWNMRTLLLMARAGLIELEAEQPAQFDPAASPEGHSQTIGVRIFGDGHRLPNVWRTTVEPIRQRTVERAQRHLRLMRSVLLERSEVASALADLYRVRSGRWEIDVVPVCGGCGVDRDREAVPDYHVPAATPIHKVLSVPQQSHWAQQFPWLDPRLALIFYDTQPEELAVVRAQLIQFVMWVVKECGVLEVAVARSAPIHGNKALRSLYRQSPFGLVVHRDESLESGRDEPYSPLPRVSVLGLDQQEVEFTRARLLQRPFHVVLLPSTCRDPDHLSRPLVEVATNMAMLSEVTAQIAA